MSDSRQPHLVITGGHGGLARVIAARFSAGEWHVDAPNRDTLDVTDASAVTTYFSHTHPDLLICNAGAIRDAPIVKLDPADWQHVIDVNFHGARRCALAVLTEMKRRECGHVVFISSYSALHPPVGQSAYAAAKAALLGLTRDLAVEAGSYGVRANTILPGFLDTPMTFAISEDRKEAVRSSHVLGSINTPESVAAFIWHLHHELPYTSGQTFQLDSRIS